MIWGKGRTETQQPAQAPPPPVDVVDSFPRGLGDEHRPLASAKWISSTQAHDLLGAWKPGRFLLGRDAAGRYVGYDDNRHILTVAGSRAGKGVSLIVPALLTWQGSAICIDPKGELATVTACRRADASTSEWAAPGGGKVFVLDPFNRVTGPAKAFRASFNPLAGMDADSDEGFDLAGQIADALIVQQEGAGSYWTESARSFLRGLVLYIAKTQPPVLRNLLSIRTLLLQEESSFNLLLTEMKKHPGPIANAAHSLEAKPREERASARSTCDIQTEFLEGAPMKRVLAGSDFRMEDLKAGRVTVYLCLPATRLSTHGKWLRLMISTALEAMERTGLMDEGKTPVLFVLDEFAALGHMKNIEAAAGQIAGYGCLLWPIVQDLTQLQRDYKDAWQTFMGNAGLLTFWGNTDLFTLEHISKRLGECEVIRTVMNRSGGTQAGTGQPAPDGFAAFAGHASRVVTRNQNESEQWAVSQSISKTPLMAPDEIARAFARDAGNILAFIMKKDMPPVVLDRCVYHGKGDDALLGGLFDPVGKEKPLTLARERLNRKAWAELVKL